ncbi:uncharacterized protein [Amphiura filiformis]|uniref:uncharacterized protein isoform X2 n=1 Tax=Amphiura filiformis TaxID=82378 RepID=UPI003B20F0E3
MGKRGRKANKGKASQDSSVLPNAETGAPHVREKNSEADKITNYFPTSPRPSSQSQTQKDESIQVPGMLTPDTTPTKNYPKTTTDASEISETSPATTKATKETQETVKTTESPKDSPEHKRSLPNNVITEKKGVKDSAKDVKSVEKRNEDEKLLKGKEKGVKKDEGVTTKVKAAKSKGSGKSTKSRSTKQSSVQTNTLKDYFPVRRSSRRCKSDIEAEQKKDIEEAVLSVREHGLKVTDILGKGRGVVSTKSFIQGDFVVEYYGDLINIKEAKEREAEYGKDTSIGCYMYYFQFKTKQYCIDATMESGRLGRLLNHSSKSGNCCTKLVEVKGQPHLIIIAARDISEGEELLYDYGDRDKESLQAHPWLAL